MSAPSPTASARRGAATDRLRPLWAVALAAAVALAGCGSSEQRAAGSAPDPLVAVPSPPKKSTAPDPEAPRPKPHRAAPRRSLASSQRAAQRAGDARRRAADAARAVKRPRGGREQATAPATPRARAGGTQVAAPAALRAGRTGATATARPRPPCTLVPRARAGALMGVALREPSRATQGPTCIYRSVTGARFVTLAVQRASLRSLRAQIRHPRRVGIARLTGYCGTLGRPILYVGVTKGRVMSVSAPCALAARFAAIAVARLLRGG